ncbi:hypothetical protein EGR_01797 [Echinococcus granulosus]|uniref:Uncharacterized protein n=1 Tax=Echinococcus granulosus TaxID=6210 RepID=W6URI5_ECHGR|nr:hypothetical protein EGR_01797 [Echinococcus granulosus]EUB63306.1 hypothetical protein EGR_01797 [Echinococcus granulosus]
MTERQVVANAIKSAAYSSFDDFLQHLRGYELLIGCRYVMRDPVEFKLPAPQSIKQLVYRSVNFECEHKTRTNCTACFRLKVQKRKLRVDAVRIRHNHLSERILPTSDTFNTDPIFREIFPSNHLVMAMEAFLSKFEEFETVLMIGNTFYLSPREDCRANVGAVERNGSITIFRHELWHNHGAMEVGPQKRTPNLHQYKTCFRNILEILANGMTAETLEECNDVIEKMRYCLRNLTPDPST